jgi:hypothetical protein
MIKLGFLFSLLLIISSSYSQKSTISGYIKDSKTGEVLIGANIYVEEIKRGVATNLYGFYSLTLDNGEYNLKTSYLGYQDKKTKLSLSEAKTWDIELLPAGVMMEAFTVEAEQGDENVQGTQMGKVDMEVEKIKTLPAFMGEVDVLKTIQLLPGVQSSGEGNAGFYVRGGGQDQNLILLDEAVVYNASHLFGFFSVFNADAVKNISLTKGGMPANYGGRLSSVLDISMKDGNYKEYKADGGIGLIASRLTLQGPIKKDKSSFIVSGRRTYIDILAKPFVNEESAFSGSGYYFYDFNAKVNYILSDKDKIFLSGYFGKDVFTYKNSGNDFSIKIPWGNATASLRWNHLFSDKLFMNTTAIYSSYDFAFEGISDQFKFGLFSGIKDWNLKTDFSYYPNPKHNIKFGFNYIYHTFTPTNVTATSGDTEFDFGDKVNLFANEGALYFLDDFDVTDLLRINVGFRVSSFQHVGPFTRYIKDVNDNVIETKEYTRGKNIKTYINPEPRLSARYTLNETSSVKLGVTHNYQYMHLVSIAANSLPTDLWIPTTDIVKPQVGTQISTGYFKNFKENKYETSVEVYYKDLRNLVEYKEGAQPGDGLNDNVDNQLTFGKGYSYGVELYIKKALGDLTGWIGYTWSDTRRTFSAINNGLEYPAKFDRRHDLSIATNYKLNDRWTFGAVFVYATGNSVTLPYTKYFVEGNLLVDYGPRNSYRMPSYHRADVSATWYTKKFKEVKDVETGKIILQKKRFTSNWNFSIFNLYNRANPYFIYFDSEGDFTQGTLDVGAFQVSLFPILPSITWNFSF